MSLLRLSSAVAMLVVGALTVAACGDDEEPATSGDHAALGHEASSTGAAVDRAFVAGMIPHHESAIQMAEIAQELGASKFVKDLAAAIIAAQEREIETLRRVDAELEASGAEAGDLGVAEHMRGMDDDPAELRNAQPFDKAFVDMMVPHHRGAIEMAKAELVKGANAELKGLAQDIIDAQQQEIDEMNAFRETEYGAPVEEDAATHSG